MGVLLQLWRQKCTMIDQVHILMWYVRSEHLQSCSKPCHFWLSSLFIYNIIFHLLFLTKSRHVQLKISSTNFHYSGNWLSNEVMLCYLNNQIFDILLFGISRQSWTLRILIIPFCSSVENSPSLNSIPRWMTAVSYRFTVFSLEIL